MDNNFSVYDSTSTPLIRYNDKTTRKYILSQSLLYGSYCWKGGKMLLDSTNESVIDSNSTDEEIDSLQVTQTTTVSLLSITTGSDNNKLLNPILKFYPMIGQVGGVSTHKKSLLVCKHSNQIMDPFFFVFKPMRDDSRCIREIGFYELLRILSILLLHHPNSNNNNSNNCENTSSLNGTTTATATANAKSHSQMIQSTINYDQYWRLLSSIDSYLVIDTISCNGTESSLSKTLDEIQVDIDGFLSLIRLLHFIPKYYGVVCIKENRPQQQQQQFQQHDKDNNVEPEYTLVPISIPNLLDDKDNDTDTVDEHLYHTQNNETYYIMLQNITFGFIQPCVMDVKLGYQTYEPDATIEKQKKENTKYPQQRIFGMRIIGMRTYDVDKNTIVSYDKEYGKTLTSIDELIKAFYVFFQVPTTSVDNARTVHAIKQVQNLVLQLDTISQWFQNDNKSFVFYGTSLLFAYDGYADVINVPTDSSVSPDTSTNTCTSTHSLPYPVAVTKPILQTSLIRMVDFSRVRRQHDTCSGDVGCLTGIQTLQFILNSILDALNA